MSIEQRLEISGVPPRYFGATLDKFNAESAREQANKDWVLKWVADWKGRTERPSFAMIGNPGNGKTMLAAAVTRALIEGGTPADKIEYIKGRAMFRTLKDSWAPHPEHSESQLLRRYQAKKLLIIDEIEKNFNTPAEKILFHDVIDRRWDYARPTIVLGNLHSVGDLAKIVGEAATDRILANGGRVLLFDGRSRRTTAPPILKG